MALYVKDREIKKVMKQYNNRQKFDSLDEINMKDDDSKKLAQYIRDNYDTMDENEIRTIAMKCLTLSQCKKLLLSYELVNYDNNSDCKLSIDKFMKQAMKILCRYHFKAGGDLLEDDVWTIHKSDSKEYAVGANEVVFSNTIDIYDEDDKDLNYYLEQLVDKLKNIATNIKVKLKFKLVRKVVHIMIWCSDDSNKCEIDL